MSGYNSPEWVVALWALWLTGDVPMLANRWWSSAEIDHAATVLDPRYVLSDVDLDVACPHVEAAIATHPAVVEVATLGIPHAELGEELVAVVVCRAGVAPPTAQVLTSHVTGTLSSFAIPTRWEIRDEPLPTLAGEKVDKKALARSFVA